MALTAPTPPTPPTIDKGDVQPSTPRIDAHQFFEIPEMPFKKVEGREEKVEGKSEVTDTLSDNRNSAQSSNTEKNSAQISNANKNSVQSSTAEKNPAPRQEVTPEVMARDAVANGSGALTKNTVTRIDDADSNPAPAENNLQSSPAESVPVMQMPPADTSADRYERGQAVLREFQAEDKRIAESSNETPAVTSAPATFQSHSGYEEGHGGFFWIFTLIFVVLATFFMAKKFLFTAKPALKKSDLFEGTGDKLKTTAEKFSNATKTSDFAKNFDAARNFTAAKKSQSGKTSTPAKNSNPADADKKTPPVMPVTLPKKDDDGKGKHFEIRV